MQKELLKYVHKEIVVVLFLRLELNDVCIMSERSERQARCGVKRPASPSPSGPELVKDRRCDAANIETGEGDNAAHSTVRTDSSTDQSPGYAQVITAHDQSYGIGLETHVGESQNAIHSKEPPTTPWVISMHDELADDLNVSDVWSPSVLTGVDTISSALDCPSTCAPPMEPHGLKLEKQDHRGPDPRMRPQNCGPNHGQTTGTGSSGHARDVPLSELAHEKMGLGNTPRSSTNGCF